MLAIIFIETILLFIVIFGAIRLWRRMKAENESLRQQIKDIMIQQYIDNRPVH